MHIYITTCVIKHVELEFLKLYKFCALLPPDVTTNHEEKHKDKWNVSLSGALCSLGC
jgi:hypothetical protein